MGVRGVHCPSKGVQGLHQQTNYIMQTEVLFRQNSNSHGDQPHVAALHQKKNGNNGSRRQVFLMIYVTTLL